MRSIFRYCGGKSKKSVQEKIIKYFPSEDQVLEYREPFVGGGGIFFGLVGKYPQAQRWLNDVNQDLISVYLALRDEPERFIELCQDIEPDKEGETLAPAKKGKDLYNKRLKDEFDRLLSDKEAKGLDQALKYFFVNRTVWGGRVNYNLESRLYFSNPKGWNITTGPALKNCSTVLQGVKITTRDYQSVMTQPPEPGISPQNILIYCDPPYMKDTKHNTGSKLYQYDFRVEQHHQLADLIKKLPYKICLSYDNHDEIKNLYKDLNIHQEQWTYTGTSSTMVKTKKIGQELIITNY